MLATKPHGLTNQEKQRERYGVKGNLGFWLENISFGNWARTGSAHTWPLYDSDSYLSDPVEIARSGHPPPSLSTTPTPPPSPTATTPSSTSSTSRWRRVYWSRPAPTAPQWEWCQSPLQWKWPPPNLLQGRWHRACQGSNPLLQGYGSLKTDYSEDDTKRMLWDTEAVWREEHQWRRGEAS